MKRTTKEERETIAKIARRLLIELIKRIQHKEYDRSKTTENKAYFATLLKVKYNWEAVKLVERLMSFNGCACKMIRYEIGTTFENNDSYTWEIKKIC